MAHELSHQSQREVIAELVKAGDDIAYRLSRAPGIDMMRSFELERWRDAKAAAEVSSRIGWKPMADRETATDQSTRDVAVRMSMGATEAERIAELLPRLPEDVADRVVDQLWLRSVLVEQRRRTRIEERPPFDLRADRLLQALDPSDDDG